MEKSIEEIHEILKNTLAPLHYAKLLGLMIKEVSGLYKEGDDE